MGRPLFIVAFSAFLLFFSPIVGECAPGRVGAFSLPDSPWDVQWQRFQTNVQASGLELDYFIRGEIGSEENMLASLKRNRLQVGGLSLQGISSLIPEMNVAMSPFLFRSREEVDFVYDTILLEKANELLAPHDITLLRWLESGWFSIGAQSSIRSPSDIRDLRIGGSPNIAIQSFLSAVGADAIPIASVDIVQALQTGLIDGVIKPTALVYSNLRENVKVIALVRVAYDTGGLLTNKSWFDQLKPEHARALKEGHGTSAAIRQEVRDMVATQIENMRDMGIEVIMPTQSELFQWEQVSIPVHGEIVRKVGGDAQSTYEHIERALNRYRIQ